MTDRDCSQGSCPFQQAIDLLSKKHALTIIWLLQQEEPRRFNDIKRTLSINPVSLSQRLEELQVHGIISRKTFAETPPRVEYRLTQKGKDLTHVLDQLDAWASKHDVVEVIA